MKQIVFLNRFFFPDDSATSQLVSDLAFHLAGAGYDVHAIASRQRYDDPRADLAVFEVPSRCVPARHGDACSSIGCRTSIRKWP
jgi:hypothetical protein